MNTQEISFLSADGVHTVKGHIWLPEGTPRGVVQIAHGMIDYVDRYTVLVDALTAAGYAVGGADHLGHGHTAKGPEDYGYFADKDGIGKVLADLHTVTEKLRQAVPGAPVFLLGHSMGSFLTRLYAVTYGKELAGVLICSTGGRRFGTGAGIALCGLIAAFRGGRAHSAVVDKLAFGGYNKHFTPEEGPSAWLSRDADMRRTHDADPLATFPFTVGGYRDLFRLVKKVNGKAWYRAYPKKLPTVLFAGTADPVGAYGEGPRQVYQGLTDAGVQDLDLHLYEDARHELFWDSCKEEFTKDVVAWLNDRT